MRIAIFRLLLLAQPPIAAPVENPERFRTDRPKRPSAQLSLSQGEGHGHDRCRSKGSNQLAPWIQALHDRYGQRIDIDGVADVSMIPNVPSLGMFREAFRKRLAYSVMLDWEGAVVSNSLTPRESRMSMSSTARDGLRSTSPVPWRKNRRGNSSGKSTTCSRVSRHRELSHRQMSGAPLIQSLAPPATSRAACSAPAQGGLSCTLLGARRDATRLQGRPWRDGVESSRATCCGPSPS